MSDLILNTMTADLVDVQEAHHVFETQALRGERDENWPRWYAGYLTAVGWQSAVYGENLVTDLTTVKWDGGNAAVAHRLNLLGWTVGV